jgi:hypothetical protein
MTDPRWRVLKKHVESDARFFEKLSRHGRTYDERRFFHASVCAYLDVLMDMEQLEATVSRRRPSRGRSVRKRG